MDTSKPESAFQPTIERIKERLRQERETFNQHKDHENRWFLLRLVMGYSAVVLLVAILASSLVILFNSSAFSASIVTLAAGAFFLDAFGLVISIWKIVFNPDFMTKLAPVTRLEKAEVDLLETSMASPDTDKNDIIILSARYGAGNSWMDVAPILRTKKVASKIQVSVTNEELGGDPAPGIVKKIEATYAFGGRTYSKTLSEGEMLSIPES